MGVVYRMGLWCIVCLICLLFFLTSDLIFKLYCASVSPVSDSRFFLMTVK